MTAATIAKRSQEPTGELTIAQLYPRDMNIYGDTGNVLAAQRRAEAHGFAVRVLGVNQGDALPADIDMLIGGGGQDSGQDRVYQDLLSRAEDLRARAEAGVPMLMICGLYQLFGHWFRTSTGREIPGIGILDVTTTASAERLIGNLVVQSEEFGEIIGYENHSGLTSLGQLAQPLGTVLSGEGNNLTDNTEGARVFNVIGSYLHGSLLPKNPAITDFLIRAAAERKYGVFEPRHIDDVVVQQARQSVKSRPR